MARQEAISAQPRDDCIPLNGRQSRPHWTAIRCLQQTSFTKTTQMPCLLDSFSRIRAFEVYYLRLRVSQKRKSIASSHFPLKQQRGAIWQNQAIHITKHAMSCVPSWLRFRLKAEKGLLHPPRKPVITLRLTSDVWFVNLNHLSSFVYICQYGLRWQERSLGSSQWIFWCIYRPKNASKNVKHGKNASKQLWVRRGFAEATTRRGTRFHEHHVGILVAWLSLLLLKCYGINGLA